MKTRKKIIQEMMKWTLWIALVAGGLQTGKWQKAAIPAGCDIILPLEFAHSTSEVNNILYEGKCASQIAACVIENTIYDNIFVLWYTAVIIFSFYLFWRKVSLHPIPALFWILMFTPGVCDLIENNFIMLFSSSQPVGDFFWIYFWAVRIKWAVAIPFALMAMAMVLHLILLIAELFVAILDLIRTAVKRSIKRAREREAEACGQCES